MLNIHSYIYIYGQMTCNGRLNFLKILSGIVFFNFLVFFLSMVSDYCLDTQINLKVMNYTTDFAFLC